MKKFARIRKQSLETIEEEQQRIAEGKDNARTYYTIGNAHLWNFNFDKAIDAYNNTEVKFYGKSARLSKFISAWCYKAKGDYASAIKAYSRFRNISIDYRIFAEYEMSLAYIRLGEIDKARSIMSDETKDEYPAGYRNLVEKYFKSISKP